MKKSNLLLMMVTLASSCIAITGCNKGSQPKGSDSKETGPQVEADKDYEIRIYSNSNSAERVTWLKAQAQQNGFKISIDDNNVISGDTAAVQSANEKKDGDILFGLNETRWSQVIKGDYANLSLTNWTPSWAKDVGDYKFDGKAYGLVIQNILMLYRTDELGTNGKKLEFKHWLDIVDCGYKWYRQGKVGGTTNANINNSMLYPYVDPTSLAGGISVDGWKKLWKYCANGDFTGDSYGFDPLNKGQVQVSTFYSSSLYGKINGATGEKPLKGTLTPENWDLVKIEDGTYYIAEYLGVLNNSKRTDAQTAQVKAFAEWFGSAEVQAEWGEEFDSYPCNNVAAQTLYKDKLPSIYTIKNFATNKVDGETKYFEYVAAHSSEWTNIMTNLGFYWADKSKAPTEPEWDTLDWATLTQKK